jgi:hypothetical protein
MHNPPEEGNVCDGHGNAVKFSSVNITKGRMVLYARQSGEQLLYFFMHIDEGSLFIQNVGNHLQGEVFFLNV